MSEFTDELKRLDLAINLPSKTYFAIEEKFKDWQPPKELVEVPQIMADFIENKKGDLKLYGAFHEIYKNMHGTDLHLWVSEKNDRQESFAKAWIDGYTVEKEQLYVLKFPNRTNPYVYYVKSNMITQQCSQIEDAKRFTESEIKAIDERYWAFAVPVDEV